jgi:hypothetical protein
VDADPRAKHEVIATLGKECATVEARSVLRTYLKIA